MCVLFFQHAGVLLKPNFEKIWDLVTLRNFNNNKELKIKNMY